MDRITAALGVVVPCGLIGITLALGWPWWAALPVIALGVAAYARRAKRDLGLMSAMFATTGFTLLVERGGADPFPVRLVELGAFVLLLIVAAVTGGLPEV